MPNASKRKPRPLCKICNAAVSTRNCDRASFGARNPTPTVVFESKETGRTSEESFYYGGAFITSSQGGSEPNRKENKALCSPVAPPVSSAEKQQREDEKTKELGQSEEEKLEARCRAKGIII